MTTDMFVIYQINDAEKNREYRCRSYAYQIEHGFMITTDNYEISYCGKASQGLVPAKIRENMESLNPDKSSEIGFRSLTACTSSWKSENRKVSPNSYSSRRKVGKIKNLAQRRVVVP